MHCYAFPEDGKKIFIRVVQVDIDGTSVPGKVVQVQAQNNIYKRVRVGT